MRPGYYLEGEEGAMEAGVKRRGMVAGMMLAAAAVGPAWGQANRGAPAAAPPAQAGIELNSASRDDLMTLDGIGEVRADAIIRARPFRLKTELVERRLIPEALYEKINAKVWVRPPPPSPPAAPAPAAPRR
jgi:competence protein ComEA